MITVGDRVLYRIGGTDDFPVLRPGVVTTGEGLAHASIRVFLEPEDHLAAHELALITRPHCEAGSAFFALASRGVGIGQFALHIDYGRPP